MGMALGAVAPVFAAVSFRVQAADGQPGQDVVVTATAVPRQQLVNFVVLSPADDRLLLKANSGTTGIARVIVPRSFTATLGTYSVQAYLPGGAGSADGYFRIARPGPDAQRSTLVAASSAATVADGSATARLTVTLRDASGQPLAGEQVRLVSRRTTDTIAVNPGMTGSNGSFTFLVSSTAAGTGEFRAVHAATAQPVGQAVSVVFVPATSSDWDDLFGNFGKSLAANSAIGNDDTTVAAASTTPAADDVFDTTSLSTAADLQITAPAKVARGQPFSVTVKAVDAQGKPATNFRGTVVFSVPDDANATVPLAATGYTFRQGEASHTFQNAFVLNTTGTMQIMVDEIEQLQLSAAATVEVTDDAVPTGGSIAITSPKAGSTMALQDVAVQATGEANYDYAVYLNGTQVDTASADGQGKITATLRSLQAGEQELVLHQLDSTGNSIAQSDPVSFTIEVSEAGVRSLRVLPGATVAAGAQLTIQLETEDAVDAAVLTLDGIDTPMTGTGTSWTLQLAAPMNPGEYPLDLAVTTSTGELASLPGQGKLTVTPKQSVLPLPRNFRAEVKDGAVQLRWDALETPNDATGIAVLMAQDAFGFAAAREFTAAADSQGLLITDLTNSRPYYFAIEARDKDGNKGQRSSIVSATPMPEALRFTQLSLSSDGGSLYVNWTVNRPDKVGSYAVLYGIASGQYLESAAVAATPTGTASAQLQYLVPGGTYYLRVQARDATGTVVATTREFTGLVIAGQLLRGAAPTTAVCVGSLPRVDTVQVLRRGSERIASWQAVQGATGYQVYAGESLDALYPITIVQGGETTARLRVPNASKYYYIAVEAVCQDEAGRVLTSSTRLSAITRVGSGMVVAGVLALLAYAGYAVARRRARAQ